MSVVDEFLETYDNVFDMDGNVKACGRNMTSHLIVLSQQLDSNTDFGNSETGYMHVGSIRRLKKSLIKD